MSRRFLLCGQEQELYQERAKGSSQRKTGFKNKKRFDEEEKG